MSQLFKQLATKGIESPEQVTEGEPTRLTEAALNQVSGGFGLEFKLQTDPPTGPGTPKTPPKKGRK